MLAVLPFGIENTTAASKVASIRALVWGRVRLDMLKYAAAPDTAITPAQRDALRSYGIVSRKVTNWSGLDNQ